MKITLQLLFLAKNLRFMLMLHLLIRRKDLISGSPEFFRMPSAIDTNSAQDLTTGGPWFDPRLGQYSFRGWVIVMATGFISLRFALF